VSASLLLALGGAQGAAASGSRFPLYSPKGAHLQFRGREHRLCAAPTPGAAACLGRAVLKSTGNAPAPAAVGVHEVLTPYGLSSSTIKAVYGYSASATAGAGKTVAIVDAYNDPHAASDLERFSSQYGLPSATLTQVNGSGGSALPATEPGWDLEISLDIEWVHALAPAAHILLVEAANANFSSLFAAEQYAAEHASIVSNSWGGGEFASEASYDSYFSHPGVSYFAAAGDTASEMGYPSASPDVTSVGGTTISLTSGGTLASETAWNEGGGGCSRYETPNSAQRTGSVSCAGKRATPDVALDGDPNSGASVYDSIATEGQSGWWEVGGTSASTAMWAGITAAYGSSIDAAGLITAPYIYANPALIPYRDITSGSNGHPTLSGYDLATGLGTWAYTPGAPTGLTATREGGQVKLAWSAPTGAAAGEYVIWRGTASGEETTLLVKVPAPGTTYTDTTAAEGTTYYYEVQAVNGAGNGPFSAQAAATGPSTPPVAKFTTSCLGSRCNFTSTSTDEAGTINAYAWNGGNGVKGTSSTFADSYSSAGTYTVSLVVKNTAGQSSPPATRQVTCSRTRRFTLTCS
jgi:subtilase family serine protease